MKAKSILPKRHKKIFKTKSLTKQNHKAECDINTILKRYEQTGIITHVNNKAPQYGNFNSDIDYQQSLNSVIEAQDQFDQLPSHIRERFQNNPAELLKFISSKENKEEAIKLGLIDAPQINSEDLKASSKDSKESASPSSSSEEKNQK